MQFLYQLNRRPEEWPVRVHLLELFELAVANLYLQRRAHTQPHRQLKTCLRPCKHPRNGSQGFNAALTKILKSQTKPLH